MKLLKYGKAFISIFLVLFLLNIFASLLYYFHLVNSHMMHYIKLFIAAFSMLVGGIYLGSKASKKGWLEGMKIGLGMIFFFFLIRYFAFDQGIQFQTILYYWILLISSMLGSMLGINKRKAT